MGSERKYRSPWPLHQPARKLLFEPGRRDGKPILINGEQPACGCTAGCAFCGGLPPTLTLVKP